MKAVVIGLGSIGSRRLRDIAGLQVEIGAICDPDHRALTNACPPTAETQLYDDPEVCLAEHASGNMVLVCSPTSTHFPLAMKAIDNGCAALLVEKPPSLSTADAEYMADAARTLGTRAAVAFNWRFHPAIGELKNRLDRHPMRTVHLVGIDDISLWPNWNSGDNYMLDPKEGGVVLTSTVHSLDLLLYLMGPAQQVSCSLESLLATSDVHSRSIFMMLHESGMSMAFNDWDVNQTSVISITSPLMALTVDLRAGAYLDKMDDMHRDMMKAFVGYANGLPAGELSTFDDGLNVMRLVDAGRRAASERRYVDV